MVNARAWVVAGMLGLAQVALADGDTVPAPGASASPATGQAAGSAQAAGDAAAGGVSGAVVIGAGVLVGVIAASVGTGSSLATTTATSTH